MAQYKSGFVAVVGRPNVGKSSLLNALIGFKVAIVSDKPQTTRNKIQCVLTRDDAQIVFLDTPGIHKPQHKLGEYMVKAAKNALNEVEVVIMMVDVTGWRKADDYILEELANITTPVILVANKTDLVSKEQQAQFVADVKTKYQFNSIIPVSALQQQNLDLLVDTLVDLLPEDPQYYPDDWVTDHPERFVVAEFIREQIFLHTEKEIPHSVAVDVDEMKTDAKGLVRIRATIYVDRDSQKGIIIGSKGKMLKTVGSAARQQIENILGSQVFLDLWVKVKKDWRDKMGALKEFGYE